MNPLPILVALSCTAALLRPPATDVALPSDPHGVYTLLDKVVLLPDAQAPNRVELWGAFALALGRSGQSYRTPQWGVLLLRAPDGKTSELVPVWQDLAKVAGTGTVVGFSSRYEQKDLQVVAADATRPEPGVMPAGWGVHKAQNSDWGPLRELRLLPRPLAPVRNGPAAQDNRRGGQAVEFRFANCAFDDPELRYVVTVQSGQECLASPLLKPGKDETRWTAELGLSAGERITWRVHAVSPKAERTPVASASFVVGKS